MSQHSNQSHGSDSGEPPNSGLSKRTIQWKQIKYSNSLSIWWPVFHRYEVCCWFALYINGRVLKELQIPQLLHDKIAARPRKRRRRLQRFHDALSNNCDSEEVLSKCVWVSDDRGHPCHFSREHSVANKLEIVQTELSKTKTRNFTICAINSESAHDIESYVPWYVSISISPATHLRTLLELILDDCWFGYNLAAAYERLRLRIKDPAQLSCNLQLPSKSQVANSNATEEKFLVTLQWLQECPAFDTFLRSHDWYIYIWQPYLERPQLDTVRLEDVTAPGSAHHRFLMIANSGRTLKSLKHEHDQAVNNGAIVMSLSAQEQMLESLLASVRTVVKDTSKYVVDSVDLLHRVARNLSRGSS